jgi:endonuclease YncB( thermonuclease family)
MLDIFGVVATCALAIVAGAADDKKSDSSKTVIERVGGQFKRHKDDNLFRITGKVKVLDAHTIRYEDGTDVDLNGGMEAPELEQKGLIGDSFYPCGKEAADFLRKLIGDNPVVCYADTSHVADKKICIASAFVGETNLNIEMVRNGWALSDHSGMTPWEVIARDNKRGLWRGKFIVPSRWLKGDRLSGE